jgi:hypothetical protein
MPSTNGHYDENLLKAAPAATKAEMQEGYNVDLLNQTRNRPETRSRTTPAATASSSDPELAAAKPPPRSVSFWGTNKGRYVILFIVIVVIGAVVGGAVGGTRKSKKNVSITEPASSAHASGTAVNPSSLPTEASGDTPVGSSSSRPAATSAADTPQAPASSAAAQPVGPGQGN